MSDFCRLAPINRNKVVSEQTVKNVVYEEGNKRCLLVVQKGYPYAQHDPR